MPSDLVFIAGSEKQKEKVCNIVMEGGFSTFALTEPGAGSDAGSGRITIRSSSACFKVSEIFDDVMLRVMILWRMTK